MTYNQFSRPDGARLALDDAVAAPYGTREATTGGAGPARGACVPRAAGRGRAGARALRPPGRGGGRVTRRPGDGSATYIGAMTSPETLQRSSPTRCARRACGTGRRRSRGRGAPRREHRGREVTFLLNYSGSTVTLPAVAGCSVLAGGMGTPHPASSTGRASDRRVGPRGPRAEAGRAARTRERGRSPRTVTGPRRRISGGRGVSPALDPRDGERAEQGGEDRDREHRGVPPVATTMAEVTSGPTVWPAVVEEG